MRVVAIDGPVGSGKSTVAKAVASRLGLPYLESGAMYRVVAWAAVQRGIDPEAADALTALAAELDMEVGERILVEGADITGELRSPEVGRAVSAVAATPGVRTELVRRQREWVEEQGGAVVEGRDIGSVVFPDADVKVFLTADADERARRRTDERPGLGADALATDLRLRDESDAARMQPADDAERIDTTALDVEDVVRRIEQLVRARVA